jgi:Na+/H+ antiporter NhaD/arsenite permease-like protein
MKKLLDKREDRLFFAGMIVIAANAGGAWTPIGDVTTTMLWIGGQVTTVEIMKGLFIPSMINLLVPLAVTAYLLRGRLVEAPPREVNTGQIETTAFERQLMFFLGLGILVAVPAFKTITHLPPFLGILFGLGLLWLIGDLMHRQKSDEDKERLTLVSALTRIDMSSILFFVGILLAVASLEHAHILTTVAHWLNDVVGRLDVIVILIGLVSVVWEFMADCAGTGGSILIIGSAAGVAAMGLEKIDFLWYMKKISLLALLGYFGGAIFYIFEYQLTH